MFLVVKYHIIRPPPPPAWARLLNKPKSQKIVGHWISKNLGLWISKNRGTLIFKKSWTMNFQKSWDIDFQKFLDCDIFWKILKFSNFGIMKLCFWIFFLYIDFVWYCWFCWFCWYFENLWKSKTFIFLIQSILFSG